MAIPSQPDRQRSAATLLRDNSLSLVVFGLFVLFWIGQLLTGWSVANDANKEHGQPGVTFYEYVGSFHALQATAENWESEFLQMCAFALVTSFLFQRGSAESRDPDKPAQTLPIHLHSDAPWPVKRGGWIAKLYEHSLSLSLALLFLLSFVLHIKGGTGLLNKEYLREGKPQISEWQYLGTARMWFESFQNWQSEFLSIGAMVVLTIFLREKNSPESKRVESPHHAHD